MLTYAELAQRMREKFSRYTKEQCEFALQDIATTMRIMGEEKDYTRKLEAERDAALERLQQIGKQLQTKEQVLRKMLKDRLSLDWGSPGGTDITLEALEDIMCLAYDAGVKSR